MAPARIGGRMPEAIREMEKKYQLSPDPRLQKIIDDWKAGGVP